MDQAQFFYAIVLYEYLLPAHLQKSYLPRVCQLVEYDAKLGRITHKST